MSAPSGTSGAGRRNKSPSPEDLRREAEAHPGLLARVGAAQILQDIIVKGHSLDDRFAPDAIPARLQGLDGRDRALSRAIVTVALRRLGSIRLILNGLLEKGLPRQANGLEWILVTAIAQILFLDVPDHAAIDLAVRATRLERATLPYASLVNGALRTLARQDASTRTLGDPLDHDTPRWLAERWKKTYGEDVARTIAAAHQMEPTLDLTVARDPQAWAERLGAYLLPTGSLRLATHQPIPDIEGFTEGAWWVQDAAAALPARLLKAAAGMRVADFCAAPGGKAAQLATAGAAVTAIDRSAERLKRLAANFERLGLSAEVVVADVLNLKGTPFDAVLVDAPCSATGTIRRHPDVLWTKKASDISTLVSLQAKMLDRAVEMVKPGGTIVYCVCSLEPEEGELQIPALLRRNPDVERLPIDASEVGGLHEVVTATGDLRTLPSHLPASDPRLAGLDGFFAARLIRRG